MNPFEAGLEGRRPTEVATDAGAIWDFSVLVALLLAAGFLVGVLS